MYHDLLDVLLYTLEFYEKKIIWFSLFLNFSVCVCVGLRLVFVPAGRDLLHLVVLYNIFFSLFLYFIIVGLNQNFGKGSVNSKLNWRCMRLFGVEAKDMGTRKHDKSLVHGMECLCVKGKCVLLFGSGW